MIRSQVIGALGAMVAVAVIGLVYFYAPILFMGVTIPADDPAHRMAFAVSWLLLPGLTLLAGVWAAARRGFYPDAIEGTRTPSDYGLEINLRYNTNTVEQVLLATIALVGLAEYLPLDRLVLIPAMTSLFAVGRITFWIGYLIHPMGRAFGMVLTIFPTILAFGWLTLTLIREV
jgi:hypothetical protein